MKVVDEDTLLFVAVALRDGGMAMAAHRLSCEVCESNYGTLKAAYAVLREILEDES